MKNHKNNRERGIALMFVLFTLLLLTAIAGGLMYMADTETNINSNYRAEQQAYFGAVAGIQEARQRLINPGGDIPPLITTMPVAAANTGVVYITNPSVTDKGPDTPWANGAGSPFFDDELCHENFTTLYPAFNPTVQQKCLNPPIGNYYQAKPSNIPVAGTVPALSYKWVRITLKQNESSAPYTVDGNPVVPNLASPPNGAVDPPPNATTQICFDGIKQLLKPAGYDINCFSAAATQVYKPVYIVTALAVAQGSGRRMMQMEVADTPPLVTNAAVDTNDFVSTSGSSLTINGYDNCKCSCTIAKGVAQPVCTDRSTGQACTGSTYAIYTSQTVTSSGQPAFVSGTNPPVAQNQPFPYDVPSLITMYKTAPGAVNVTGPPYNSVCSGTPPVCTVTGSLGTPPNPFPPADPNNPIGLQSQITYIPGSATLPAHTPGAGVLVVDGDLTINGGMDFYGLILVKGVITLAGGGTGQNLNILGSVLAGQGGVADAFKGSWNIQFDRCALLRNTILQPPAILSAREVIY